MENFATTTEVIRTRSQGLSKTKSKSNDVNYENMMLKLF